MENKYMAWIEEYHELCEVLLIDFVNNMFCVLPEANLEGGNQVVIENKMHLLKRFTGKQDKNDTDIYEGNICKITRFGDEFIIGKIFFDSGCFHIENGYALCGTDCLSHIKSNIIEIIGDIDQNPEFFKIKDDNNG